MVLGVTFLAEWGQIRRFVITAVVIDVMHKFKRPTANEALLSMCGHGNTPIVMAVDSASPLCVLSSLSTHDCLMGIWTAPIPLEGFADLPLVFIRKPLHT